MNHDSRVKMKFCLKTEDSSNYKKHRRISYRVRFTKNKDVELKNGCYQGEIQLHPQWHYYLNHHIQRYRSLRFHFFSWIFLKTSESIEGNHCKHHRLCEHCYLTVIKYSYRFKSATIKLKFTFSHVMFHTVEPDLKWSTKILHQMQEQLQLEAAFAWLSTLGGAHSSLGDHFDKNAQIAWQLSVKQFFIAIKMGSPVLASHCKLFMSISLMQRGFYHAASKFIRSVSRNIMTDKRLREQKLINCCNAAKVRLKHFCKTKKLRLRNDFHSVNGKTK